MLMVLCSGTQIVYITWYLLLKVVRDRLGCLYIWPVQFVMLYLQQLQRQPSVAMVNEPLNVCQNYHYCSKQNDIVRWYFSPLDANVFSVDTTC